MGVDQTAFAEMVVRSAAERDGWQLETVGDRRYRLTDEAGNAVIGEVADEYIVSLTAAARKVGLKVVEGEDHATIYLQFWR